MCPLFALQVFNLNAPVPPASETEALSQASQYQTSYNQAFSSQSQHPVEQAEMQSEQLQSGGQIFNFCFPFFIVDLLIVQDMYFWIYTPVWLTIDLHRFFFFF